MHSAILRAATALTALTASHVYAATLNVGPGQTYSLPSQAAAAAQSGDTIVIAPGTYTDCSVWNANNLTIRGGGIARTLIGGTSCQGKGVFVVYGSNITISDLNLRRASVPDMNGAGIRAEGTNLTVQRVHLTTDQDGLLADPVAASVITITDSFIDNDGLCAADCAHGIYVDGIAKLVVQHSTIRNIHVGHGVKSRAAITQVTDCTIEDGTKGTSSYLIDAPNGGQVTISGNYLEKGPLSSNPYVAISIGEEGVTWSSNSISVTNNSFRNDNALATTFVDNTTSVAAQLTGNTMAGLVAQVLEGLGTVN